VDTRYLIIGGGMAADAAVKAIRRADPEGNIVLVSEERHPPYKRPPLSKGLWKGDDEAKIDLKTAAAATRLLLGKRATRLDLADRRVALDDGTSIAFERLLLATGARARPLPGLPDSPRVVAYRTLDDYRHVRELARPGAKAVVIGGGFIGSEIAAALRLAGIEVAMVFPEAAIGSGRFPDGLARAVTQDYQGRGVRVLAGRTVASAEERDDSSVVLTLDDGSELVADLVVVGVGTVPNDELARDAGLATDRGVLVDATLRAQRLGGGEAVPVYAAGDVASFAWPGLERRMRIEHEDNAYSMGAAAGRAMALSLAQERGLAGAAGPRHHDHLPFFYSDLFDAGYEAVGLLDTRLDLVEDWRVPGREGVVYYLEDGRVRGVLLWNTWGQVDAARELVLGGQAHAPEDLLGRLPTDDHHDP